MFITERDAFTHATFLTTSGLYSGLGSYFDQEIEETSKLFMDRACLVEWSYDEQAGVRFKLAVTLYYIIVYSKIDEMRLDYLMGLIKDILGSICFFRFAQYKWDDSVLTQCAKMIILREVPLKYLENFLDEYVEERLTLFIERKKIKRFVPSCFMINNRSLNKLGRFDCALLAYYVSNRDGSTHLFEPIIRSILISII